MICLNVPYAKAARCSDASGGRITAGVNYMEQVGAVGLPWNV